MDVTQYTAVTLSAIHRILKSLGTILTSLLQKLFLWRHGIPGAWQNITGKMFQHHQLAIILLKKVFDSPVRTSVQPH